MLGGLTIKRRLMIIVGIGILGLLILGADEIIELRHEMIANQELETRNLVEVALTNIEQLHAQAEAGALTADEARQLAREMLRGTRYGEGDYFFIIDTAVRIVMHPFNQEIEGEDASTIRDSDGVALFAEMVRAARAGGGSVHYRWTRAGSDGPLPKISYAAAFEPWGWVVATGTYVDDIEAAFWAQARHIGLIALAISGVSLAIAYLVSSSITRSIAQMTGIMRRLAVGETGLTVPSQDMRTEIGEMARSVEVFRVNAVERERLEAEQKRTEGRIAAERRKALLSVLHDLVNVSVEGNEAQILMATMKRDVSETAREVQTMASAVDEMRAAVQEIAHSSEAATSEAQVSEDATSAGKEKAGEATASMDQMTHSVDLAKAGVSELAEASARIGDIVEQIESIAAQTNLLALNATIEAARAGDAGKGFAIVASEVKTLAQQTGGATEDIRSRIGNVRGKVDGIIAAMDESAESVGSGRAVVDRLAGSLDGISENVNRMASRMSEIAGVLTEQSAASEEMARSANVVSDIATRNATEIDGVIDSLSRLSDMLNSQVGSFADLGDLAIIEIAKNDHMIFKRRIIDAMVGRSDVTADDLPDSHHCRLGKWYDQAGERIRSTAAFAKLQGPHQRVHDIGKTVLRLLRSSKFDEALDAVSALNAASHEVLDLLDALSREVQETLNEEAAA